MAHTHTHITVTVDTSGIAAAMAKLQAAVNEMVTNMARQLDRMGWRAEKALTRYQDHARRREVMLSGMEARWYVQGGLECRSEDDLAELVRRTFRDRWLMDLTQAEAIRLVVAAMTGYAQHARRELVCLSCLGLGEWETTEAHPAYRRLVTCRECDGSGEWNPRDGKGLTQTLTWTGYIQRLRAQRTGWASLPF